MRQEYDSCGSRFPVLVADDVPHRQLLVGIRPSVFELLEVDVIAGLPKFLAQKVTALNVRLTAWIAGPKGALC